ncbi:MAG: helix-turn-helix transcriptional regulator, partial [Lysobacteraceae bacterium]
MTQAKAEIAAMFEEVWNDADFHFDIKAQEVAIDLARALEEAGMTRVQLCEKLGWQPSRMSKVLGGGANLTLKTLWQLCGAIGLEYDVVLRTPEQDRAAQPWEARHLGSDIRRLHSG